MVATVSHSCNALVNCSSGFIYQPCIKKILTFRIPTLFMTSFHLPWLAMAICKSSTLRTRCRSRCLIPTACWTIECTRSTPTTSIKIGTSVLMNLASDFGRKKTWIIDHCFFRRIKKRHFLTLGWDGKIKRDMQSLWWFVTFQFMFCYCTSSQGFLRLMLNGSILGISIHGATRIKNTSRNTVHLSKREEIRRIWKFEPWSSFTYSLVWNT